jgi:hypothetical protein
MLQLANFGFQNFFDMFRHGIFRDRIDTALDTRDP